VREGKSRRNSGVAVALPRVLGEPCTSVRWSARLVGSLYACTSMIVLLIGVRSSCSFLGLIHYVKLSLLLLTSRILVHPSDGCSSRGLLIKTKVPG
jgi:hypothetical protein